MQINDGPPGLACGMALPPHQDNTFPVEACSVTVGGPRCGKEMSLGVKQSAGGDLRKLPKNGNAAGDQHDRGDEQDSPCLRASVLR